MFSSFAQRQLARAALFGSRPAYVQFYVTARCNLTCQQCHIIYANSDVRECTLDEIRAMADNFRRIGVPIVLLTGGEPFLRQDLPDIIRAFESRGIHVRMQTNGLASEEQIRAAVDAGGRDISISLDSLRPAAQDTINGGFHDSWHRALQAAALFTRHLPRERSFASFGCVLQRDNLDDVENVIRFATAVSWFASLVPIHVTDAAHPMNFRTYDQSLRFHPEEFPRVERLVERVRQMRREGYLLYDSDQYLDDVKRFVREEPTTWRARNHGVCDSPALYFAVLPNGDLAPCCDFRLSEPVSTVSPDFPQIYRQPGFREKVLAVTRSCPGCMFGSFPEITISMRFLRAKLQRIRTFLTAPPQKKWPVTYEEMLALAARIQAESSSTASS